MQKHPQLSVEAGGDEERDSRRSLGGGGGGGGCQVEIATDDERPRKEGGRMGKSRRKKGGFCDHLRGEMKN